MSKEPEWIEHDGSAVCPVPAGPVDVRYRSGREYYWLSSTSAAWANVSHYRDWTVFEQQQASKDAPRLLTEEVASYVWYAAQGYSRDAFLSNLRGMGWLPPEPEPVDPLLVEARKQADMWWPGEGALAGSMDDSMWMERILAALRRGMELARGVTLARGGGVRCLDPAHGAKAAVRSQSLKRKQGVLSAPTASTKATETKTNPRASPARP